MGRTRPATALASLLLLLISRLSAGAIVIDITSPVLAEGTSIVYNVRLTAAPESTFWMNTTVLFPSSQAQSLVSIHPGSVEFNKSNWDVRQFVTLTAEEDPYALGSFEGTVRHTLFSSDADWNASEIIPSDRFNFSFIDNDAPGILCIASDTVLFSAQSRGKVSCQLLSMPTSDVHVTGHTAIDSQIVFHPKSLLWQPENSSVVAELLVSRKTYDFTGVQTSVLALQVDSYDPVYNQIRPLPGDAFVFHNVGELGIAVIAYFSSAVAVEGTVVKLHAYLTKAPAHSITLNISSPQGLQPLMADSATLNSNSWGMGHTFDFLVLRGAAVLSGTSTLAVNLSATDVMDQSPVRVLPSSSVNLHIFSPSSECQLSCPAGWFAIEADGSSSCQKCLPGQVCLGNCNRPQQCPAGTASSIEGSRSLDNCTACAPGSYSTLPGSTRCTQCPENHFCQNSTLVPVACPVGSVALPGSFQCTTCPAGHSCLSAMRGVQPCPSGTYTVNGSLSCISCPPGHECSGILSAPQICRAGTFSGPGQSLCSACPIGTYSPVNGSEVCSPCPSGYRCSANAVLPVPCATGTYSTELSHQCLTCPSGTFTNQSASTRCSACPAGFECRTPASYPTSCKLGSISAMLESVCRTCPLGSFPDDLHSACLPCPSGFACPNPALPPIPCPPGTYSNLIGGTIACLSCPIGYSCPGLAAHPLICPARLFPVLLNSSCAPCPPGFSCHIDDNGYQQRACRAGTYQDGTHFDCLPCPPGFVCPSPEQSPQACQPHTTANQNQTACRACLAGHACSAVSESPCQAGEYWDQRSSCVPCPPGHMCSSQAITPWPCPAGTYQPLPSMQNCSVCPAGYACDGAVELPEACPPGFVSPSASSACFACPAGYQCPNGVWDAVAPCPLGTVSLSGEVLCFPCPAGVECPSTSSAIQRACALGQFSAGGQSTCQLCPEGFACQDPTGGQIVSCPIGQISPIGYPTCISESTRASANLDRPGTGCGPGTFSYNSTHCTDCPAGQACPKTGEAFSFFCGAGSFSVGGQSTCTQCPAGFYCTDTTLAAMTPCPAGTYSIGGLSECRTCPAGHFCEIAAELPRACGAGTYSFEGSSSCTDCPAGYYCSFAAGTAALPQQCPRGTWAPQLSTHCAPSHPGFVPPAGSTNGSHPAWVVPAGRYHRYQTSLAFGSISVEILCPAGRFGDLSGTASVDSGCPFECPEGFFCQAGTHNGSLQTCPSGAFCERASGVPAFCPAGRYSSALGNVGLSDCEVCSEGRACPAQGTVTPIRCLSGFFCPSGSTSATRHPCPSGTYQPIIEQNSVAACLACPPGAFCTTGSSTPVLCPVGTFSDRSNLTHVQQCQPCPAGVVCSRRGLVQPDTACAAGYYCPRGSGNQFDYPCPAGTYTYATNLTSSGECLQCPAGFACRPGTSGAQPMILCPAGYFCPPQTKDPRAFQCPAGTFSSNTGLQNANECGICPAGRFCTGGMSSSSGPCEYGHYCPEGTHRATQFACPAGRFGNAANLTSALDCQICPEAQYCPSASPTPRDCPEGTYSAQIGLQSADWQQSGVPACRACPAGSFCGRRSRTPQLCSLGTFSPQNASRCSACLVGHSCPSSNTTHAAMIQNMCPAGKYCPLGTAVVSDAVHNCSAGHFCPHAAQEEFMCAPGTFGPVRGLPFCLVCPPGKFCLAASVSPGGDCQAGHYCPAGSSSAQAEWCPLGTYNPNTGAHTISACLECPAGYFCGGATVSPQACPPGSFCPPLSWHPQPCPAGTFGNTSKLEMQLKCTPCLLGMFCDETGLKAPVGLCDPGYFCTRGSPTSSPTSPGPPWVEQEFTYGGVCPRGGFCPSGSFEPTPCPPGTYSNISGAANHEDCERCPAGFYCAFTAKPEPTGPCLPGYYCEVGSNSSMQHLAPPGYYAPAGSPAPILCPPGRFSASMGMPTCNACPAGYECPTEGMQTPQLCLSGTYCPLGTDVAILCPAGSFSQQLGAGNVSTCSACPAGQFCQFSGLSNPTGPCEAGFICSGGSALPDPDARLGGFICPAGAYCPAAVSAPRACPVGTFSSSQGLSAELQCRSCKPGFFCSRTGLEDVEGPCSPGYFCAGGSHSRQPIGFFGMNDNGVCPAGHECPEGTSQPQQCQPGSYSNTTRTSACNVCPAGFTCATLATVSPQPCGTGEFCPPASVRPQLCPPGTYSNAIQVADVSDCIKCPAGKACTRPGLHGPDANCDAGIWCAAGALSSQGHVSPLLVSNDSSLCPIASFCPEGTVSPIPCPMGTASNTRGLQSSAQCSHCPPGQFCGSPGLPEPASPCAAGYYCIGGSTSATPRNISFDEERVLEVGGGACWAGHFCTEGASSPTQCSQGTFMPQEASPGPCLPCPPGFVCGIGVATPFQKCPRGHFCPGGSTETTANECPAGTFNPVEGGANISACQTCTPGMYCSDYANIVPDGSCSEGYYCGGGSSSPTPRSSALNGRCPPGTQCPMATIVPIDCPAGSYCALGLRNTTGACAAGFFCRRASPVQRPVQLQDSSGFVGDLCPKGSFCLVGTTSPTKCPRGSFNGAHGAKSIADCAACPPGRVCPDAGTIDPLSCGAGFLCLGADFLSSVPCPIGHFCPAGSSEPLPCLAGSYANTTGNAVCSNCPHRFMCPRPQTVRPTACIRGHFCPQNSTNAVATPCPIGTYSDVQGLADSSECSACPPGFYCGETGLDAPKGLCHAGFFCRSGATAAKPTDSSSLGYQCAQLLQLSGDTSIGPFSYAPWSVTDSCKPSSEWTNTSCFRETYGGPCPQGHYCPTGSAHPTPCPAGRFGPSMALQNIGQCTLCTAGRYCPVQAATSPGRACPAGFICPEGTDVPLPNCTAGHFCPEGSKVPAPCQAGRYSPRNGIIEQCASCPGGSFCEIGAITPEPCPFGFACPGNTSAATQMACPKGTFGQFASLVDINDCTPCSPGFYCALDGAAAPTGQVLAGYYSEGGAESGTPAQSHSRGPCTTGHYCPLGTSWPVPCPTGTFSDVNGLHSAQQCQPCAVGTYCPTAGLTGNTIMCPELHLCGVSTQNVTIETLCPLSHTCPMGTVVPIACPAGKYTSTRGSPSCSVCPSGYACESGTPSPSPCEKGRFCPNGTSPEAQVACPVGTYRDETGGSSVRDCFPCLPGSFCSEAGLRAPSGLCDGGFFCALSAATSAPTDNLTGGQCQAGYVCPQASSSPTPDGKTGIGYPCPVGHFCVRGTSLPEPCRAGSFGQVIGASTCATCPTGYFCPKQSVLPELCPHGRYCPPGVGTPITCPAGSFSTEQGLHDVSECQICPAGQFCSAGQIQGPCDAGFLCQGGAMSSRPISTSEGGIPCPAGNYCPIGTESPVLCANGTFRGEVGGARQEDCGACGAGFICFDGDPAPQWCPRGFYCNAAVAFRACPSGTFQPAEGATDASACEACPAGYTCSEPGTSNYTNAVCPPGNYCPKTSVLPQQCPYGTLRETPGAESIVDCIPCPAGTFCAENGTVFADTCPGGYECAVGSIQPRPCQAGFFCPPGSAAAQSCPAGFFCPALTYVPQLCTAGTFCQAGSLQPTSCPAGYAAKPWTHPGLFSSLEAACQVCPAGTTSNSQNQTNCQTCDAGYICLEGSTSSRPTSLSEQRGYLCPAGHYCPAGALQPLSCPAGTFNSLAGAKAAIACQACVANTFSSLAGSTGCEMCSASAVSNTGSAQCRCIGFKRTYQESDGQCICEPGFEFVDEQFNRIPDQDGTGDCQPVVFSRCGSGEVRSSSGDCLSDCSSECGQTGGKLVGSSGVCECAGAVSLDTVCDAECRRLSDRQFMIEGSDETGQHEQFVVVLRYDVQTRQDTSAVFTYSEWGLSGSTACVGRHSSILSQLQAAASSASHSQLGLEAAFVVTAWCQLEPISASAGNFFGSYQQLQLPAAGFHLVQVGDTLVVQKLSSHRILQGALLPVQQNLQIINPVVCLGIFDSIVFSVDSSGSWPVYDKDSLLNTNPAFDFGAFRSLQRDMQSGANTSSFVFTFLSQGVHTFVSSTSTARRIIVRVVAEGVQCPAHAGSILPTSEESLILVGIKVNDELLTDIDWNKVMAIVGSIALVAAFFAYLASSRTVQDWSRQHFSLLEYRNFTKQFDLGQYHTKGGVTAIHMRSDPDKHGEHGPNQPVNDDVQHSTANADDEVLHPELFLPKDNSASSNAFCLPRNLSLKAQNILAWENDEVGMAETIEAVQLHRLYSERALASCAGLQIGLLKQIQLQFQSLGRQVRSSHASHRRSAVLAASGSDASSLLTEQTAFLQSTQESVAPLQIALGQCTRIKNSVARCKGLISAQSGCTDTNSFGELTGTTRSELWLKKFSESMAKVVNPRLKTVLDDMLKVKKATSSLSPKPVVLADIISSSSGNLNTSPKASSNRFLAFAAASSRSLLNLSPITSPRVTSAPSPGAKPRSVQLPADAGTGWSVAHTVSTNKLSTASLFQGHSDAYDTMAEFEVLENLLHSFTEHVCGVSLLSIERLKQLWEHAPAHSLSKELRSAVDFNQLVSSASRFLAAFASCSSSFSEFSAQAPGLRAQMLRIKQKVAQRASQEALNKVNEVFSTERLQVVNPEAFFTGKHHTLGLVTIECIWNACQTLEKRSQSLFDAADVLQVQLQQSLAIFSAKIGTELSERHSEATEEGLSFFTFNSRLQALERMVGELNAYQYYENHNEGQEEAFEFGEEHYAGHDEGGAYEASTADAELDDGHLNEMHTQEMEELQAEEYLSEDTKNRLVNDMAEDADELQQLLQDEYEQQQYELHSALAMHADNEMDEQMQRFLNEAEFIDEQEAALVELDNEQEQELETALAAMLSDGEDGQDDAQSFFRAATWDGEHEDISEYKQAGCSLLQLGNVDQALLDAEKNCNQRRAEASNCDARTQREQTRQLQALKRKLEARRLARLAALDRKLASDSEQGYSEADSAYLAGEAQVKAQEQIAADEAGLLRSHEIANLAASANTARVLAESTMQDYKLMESELKSAESDTAAALTQAEESVRTKLHGIKRRITEELSRAVNEADRERLESELSAARSEAATSLAAATAEVHERLLAMKTALQVEQANAHAMLQAQQLSDQLNNDLQQQLQRQGAELEAVQAQLRQQHQVALEDLRRQHQTELAAVATDKEAEALAARHQLEEEQLKASAMVQRHEKLSQISASHSAEKDTLRQQADDALAEYTRQQTDSAVARSHVQKKQLTSLHDKLRKRQARRAEASRQHQAIALALAAKQGQDVEALKRKFRGQEAAVAEQEAAALDRIGKADTSAAEAAAVDSAAAGLKKVSAFMTSESYSYQSASEEQFKSAQAAHDHLQQVQAAISEFNDAFIHGEIDNAAANAFHAASQLAEVRQRGELDRVKSAREQYLASVAREEQREKDFMAQARLIQQQFIREQKALVDTVGTEKMRQATSAHDRMLQRKQRRAEALAKQQAAKRAELIKQQKAIFEEKLKAKAPVQDVSGAQDVASIVAEVQAEAASSTSVQVSEEVNDAIHRHETKMESLQQKHEAELQKLRQEAEEQALQAARKATEAAERRRQERLEILAREMKEQQQWGSSQEQADAIKQQYEENVAQLNSALDEERDRQQKQLQQQLAVRKQRQLRNAQKRQALELAELANQKEATVAHIQSSSNKKRDLAALRRVLSTTGTSSDSHRGAAIEGVLRTRHADETRAMLQRQFQERNDRLKSSMSSILQDKAHEKRETLGMLEQSEATPDELEAALMDLNDKFSHLVQISKQGIHTELEAKHAAELAELRRAQMAELTDAFAQLSPQDVLRRQQAAEREEQAAQMEATKKRLLLEREKKLEAASRLRDQKQAEMQRAKEAAQEQLRLEMDAHLKKEEKRAGLQMQRQQERMEQDAKERMQQQLEMHDGDEEYKQQLLREFKENQAAMSRALDLERQRQGKSMHDQLAKRKEQKLRATERKINQELRNAEKAELSKHIPARARAQDKQRQQKAKSSSTPSNRVTPQRSVRSKQTPSGRPPRPLLQQTAAAAGKVLSQAVLGRIEKIEQALQLLTKQSAALLPMQQGPAQPAADVLEAHLSAGSTLCVCSSNQLSKEQTRMLSFASELFATIAQCMNSSGQLSSCVVQAAAELPVAVSDTNAFRRSYWFDAEQNSLYVLKQRLSSNTGLPAVLIHAAAHILCDPASMGPDSSPVFQAMHTQVTQAALSHLVSRAILQQSPPSAGESSAAMSVLSPGRFSGRDGDVPQLSLNFGLDAGEEVQGSTTTSPANKEKQYVRSDRAAKLLRSLSSRSKLFQVGAATIAAKRIADYRKVADSDF